MIENLVLWPIIILCVLYENPYIDLGLAMFVIAIIVYESNLWGLCSKKHDSDNEERDKNKTYEKIEALYKQKNNNQNKYKFIENSQTEITKEEDEKEKERNLTKLKPLIYMKLICIYFFYSFLLIYINTFGDICYFMPEIITLFSLFILIGIFLKSKHKTLMAKVIALLMAFMPMLFTGLSYYLSVIKPQNYEFMQTCCLFITGILLLILFFSFAKFMIKNRV